MSAGLPVMDASPIAALRAATRAAHEQLHVHPALACLNEGKVCLADYQRILRSFYGFYRPYEEFYRKQDNQFFAAFAPGNTSDRLTKDLQAQGITPDDILLIDAPYGRWSVAEVAGYLYLREGSGLGGQIISRRLQKSLGLVPGVDNHFFHAHGADTGPKWKHFTALLEDRQSDVDPDAASAFAAGLFTTLSDWMTARHDD